MQQSQLSPQTLRRLPLYVNYLRSLPPGTAYVSSTQMAAAMGLGDVQVRKDLAAVSGRGKPKIGYEAALLVQTIEGLLASDETIRFCIVGMGRLGTALAQYGGFAEYGLQLAATFDAAPRQVGRRIGGLLVAHTAALQPLCRAKGIRVGVITVPPEQAQAVCDALVAAGVQTIWNFAPAHLAAPKEVHIRHENMAAQLGLLSRHLQRKEKELVHA